MKHLKTFENWERLYEIDVNKTYLSTVGDKPINTYSNSVLGKTGKVFGDAPTTKGKSYNITFKEVGGLDAWGHMKYKVIFPPKFFTDYFSGPASREYSDDIGMYGNEHGDQKVPIVVDKDGKKISVEDLFNNHNVIIKTESGETNRIHFPEGIPDEFKGTGLGYIIYEAFIRYLGFGSSKPDATAMAKQIWKKIASDPDFYIVYFNSENYKGVMAIDKAISKEKMPDKIVTNFIKYYSEKVLKYDKDKEVNIDIDKELLKKFPKLNELKENPNKYSLISDIKNLDKQLNSIINKQDISDVIKNDIVNTTEKIQSRIKLIDNGQQEKIKEMFNRFVKSFFKEDTVKIKYCYECENNYGGGVCLAELGWELKDDIIKDKNLTIAINVLVRFFNQYFLSIK